MLGLITALFTALAEGSKAGAAWLSYKVKTYFPEKIEETWEKIDALEDKIRDEINTASTDNLERLDVLRSRLRRKQDYRRLLEDLSGGTSDGSSGDANSN